MKPEQKQLIGEFAEHMENATVGLLMNNPEIPSIDPRAYQVALGAALYAAQTLAAQGKLAAFPPLSEGADFTDFLNAAGVSYGHSMTKVAIATVDQLADAAEAEVRAARDGR